MPIKGVTQTSEAKLKISLSKRGNKNYNWKGNNATKRAIHIFLRKNIPRPELCVLCYGRPPTELANISDYYNPQMYTLDVKNWRWLCRSCHMHDGRKTRGIEKRRENDSCFSCGIRYVDIKKLGRKTKRRHVMLNRGTDLFICRKCYWDIWKK